MIDTAKTLVIAEAGVNHNGSLDLALEMIEVAAEAGADIVKFQTFKTDSLVTSSAPKAAYQVETTGDASSQVDMLRKLELSADMHRLLSQHCVKNDIEFMSTPFDSDSLHFLCNEMAVRRLKVGSGDMTNAPLLYEIGKSGKSVILSTGMATLGEIEQALGVLILGSTTAIEGLNEAGMIEAANSEAGREYLRTKVMLLHCTTAYPTPVDQVNLNAMAALRQQFGIPVGYSDHTAGIDVALAAVALGATVIEKHFTLDRTMSGPDHRASIEPDELKDMIKGIRAVEKSLGGGNKEPLAIELANTTAARKSLVALKNIKPGQKFTRDNLGTKRPGNGISPFKFWDYLGSVADKNYEADDLIR
jgi:N-acetylneuraminate synthase